MESELLQNLSSEQVSLAFLALENPEEYWPLPEPLNKLSKQEWEQLDFLLYALTLEKKASSVH